MPTDTANESVVDAIYAHARRGMQGDVRGVAPARRAVACILWRATPGVGREIFLGQRAASLAFLGGFWTFPGGAVESGDRDDIAAAIREIAEETGMQLPDRAAAFVDAGRWITPEFSPIRFDTRFFLVEVPDGAEPDWRASDGELQDGCWVSPEVLAERWQRGDWLVPSPVLAAAAAVAGDPDGVTDRCAAAAERAHGEPRIWELTPGVSCMPLLSPTLPPATHTTCYLFGTGDLVAVDPASPYADEQAEVERVIDALARRGRRIVEIWLTHHHLDHVSGALHLAERTGATIAAHPATIERLAGRVPVARALADGETIDLAGPLPRRVRAIFTPGHAPGHLCYLEEETGFVAAGDMVAGVGTILVDPSEGDMVQYLASLRLLRDLAPRVLLPAHGGAISSVSEKLDGYVEHRLWREARVLSALRARGPAAARDLVPEAYADVPASIHGLAERSLIAHLHKLAVDGVAIESDGVWRAR